MSFQPITKEECKQLGKRLDTLIVTAVDEEALLSKLSNLKDKNWVMLRSPKWVNGKLLAILIKPRVE